MLRLLVAMGWLTFTSAATANTVAYTFLPSADSSQFGVYVAVEGDNDGLLGYGVEINRITEIEGLSSDSITWSPTRLTNLDPLFNLVGFQTHNDYQGSVVPRNWGAGGHQYNVQTPILGLGRRDVFVDAALGVPGNAPINVPYVAEVMPTDFYEVVNSQYIPSDRSVLGSLLGTIDLGTSGLQAEQVAKHFAASGRVFADGNTRHVIGSDTPARVFTQLPGYLPPPPPPPPPDDAEMTINLVVREIDSRTTIEAYLVVEGENSGVLSFDFSVRGLVDAESVNVNQMAWVPVRLWNFDESFQLTGFPPSANCLSCVPQNADLAAFGESQFGVGNPLLGLGREDVFVPVYPFFVPSPSLGDIDVPFVVDADDLLVVFGSGEPLEGPLGSKVGTIEFGTRIGEADLARLTFGGNGTVFLDDPGRPIALKQAATVNLVVIVPEPAAGLLLAVLLFGSMTCRLKSC